MAKEISLDMIWESFELVEIGGRDPCGMMSASCEHDPFV